VKVKGCVQLMFHVVRVDSRRAQALEPLGTKRKFWFNDGERRMLFKAVDRGTGEDWAEKVACELCGLIGLPHVQYELATELDSGMPGAVCESCAIAPMSLLLGNMLLLAIDPKYPAVDVRKYKVQQHTVEAVTRALNILWLPPPDAWTIGLPTGIVTALDVFVGYVMLDAWIANQDRHHENWGMIAKADNTLHLAPTFDHGASMARNVLDGERLERLTTKDRNRQIRQFVRRARSAFFSDPATAKPMTTLEAWRAFAQRAPAAAEIWAKQLAMVDRPLVEHILSQVPQSRMSGVCREFTLQLLMENQRRILAGDNQ
jgi:hypothetical protein